jgi:hypothetical protein
VLDLPDLTSFVVVDPAGTAFDGSYTFHGKGFSGAIYSKFHVRGKMMQGSKHTFELKTGEAIWNPDVDEVIGIVHAVGPDYRRTPTDAASGLKWKDVGSEEPIRGRELINEKLASQLRHNAEFTQKEWDSFGIEDLRTHHFIKSDVRYFQPADLDYFQVLEKTFASIRAELHRTNAKDIALPLISSSIYKPIDLDIDTYMKFYISMIHKYLSRYIVHLNLFTPQERMAYSKAA